MSTTPVVQQRVRRGISKNHCSSGNWRLLRPPPPPPAAAFAALAAKSMVGFWSGWEEITRVCGERIAVIESGGAYEWVERRGGCGGGGLIVGLPGVELNLDDGDDDRDVRLANR